MAIINGTNGDDSFTLTSGQAGDTVDLKSGDDSLILPNVKTKLVITGVETVTGGNADDQVTINDLPTLVEMDLGLGNDTLVVANSKNANFSSVSLTNVEIIKTASSAGTTFTFDSNDLGSVTEIHGGAGIDTIVINGINRDLSSIALSSIEVLQGNATLSTIFSISQANIAPNGTIVGGTGTDQLNIYDTGIDLSSTTLVSVDRLQASLNSDTAFVVRDVDLGSANGSFAVTGLAGTDTLAVIGSDANLTSTTLSSVEQLQGGGPTGTKFTLDISQLSPLSAIGGVGGTDSLYIDTTAFDLTSVTLSSIEVLQTGSTLATQFTVNQADLNSNGAVKGNSGADELRIAGSSIDLGSTALSSVEILSSTLTLGTVFRVNQADLASGGSVNGGAGSDTIAALDTLLNLTSTTMTSIEKVAAGTASNTTFVLGPTEFAVIGTIAGGAGSDTLQVADTVADLATTTVTLTSIEALKAGLSTTTSFTITGAQLASLTSITGGAATDDSLTISGTTQVDLSSTTLSSVEQLIFGGAGATTVQVNQADLAASGSITGDTGVDTLVTMDTRLDLSSTSSTSVEIYKAGNTGATTFTIGQDDLAASGSIVGNTATDSLVVLGTGIDLTNITLSSVEIVRAGVSTAQSYTLNASQLAPGGSIVGAAAGVDTLSFADSGANLSSVSLSSIERLATTSTDITTFTVNQADLASGGTVTGGTNTGDALVAADTQLNLASTTLSSVEVIKAGSTSGTTFIVNQADLASGGSVTGGSGNDTITTVDTRLDLSSSTLTSVEALKAGNAAATTFTLDAAQLAGLTSITGSSGSDTLIAAASAFDLSTMTVTSVENLKSVSTDATTFTVNAVAAGGSITGVAGMDDTLMVASTTVNLASTALTSIEALQAGVSADTTFTVNQADLASAGSVIGSSGVDTLVGQDTQLNLSSTTLTSIEAIKAGNAAGTVITLNAGDLATLSSVIGGAGSDTLKVGDTSLDLTTLTTTLTSVEGLAAGSASSTTFTLNLNQLVSGGSITGGAADDTLTVNGTSFDLTSTAVSSVEILLTSSTAGTTFKVNQADIAAGGSITGDAGTDTIAMSGSLLDLSSTTLTSVEALKTGSPTSTTFVIDSADLGSVASITGSTGGDTLAVTDTSDFTNVTLTSIEVLKMATTAGAGLTVNASQLVSGGSVLGGAGDDTLTINGTSFDVSSTTLSSVNILVGGSGGDTTFKLNQGDIAAGCSIVGNTGNDTITVVGGSVLDLTSTTLTSIEIFQAASGKATTFKIDGSDLTTGMSIIGSSMTTDAIVVVGPSLNLSGITISGIENIKAGSTVDTTFTIDQAFTASVAGSSGSDTLTINSTAFDLSSMKLSSVENLAAGSPGATTFTVDQADLGGGDISGYPNNTTYGTNFNDTLTTLGTILDLASTTLMTVEILKAGGTKATTFKLNQADLASGGSLIGITTANDTLVAAGTDLDLTSTTISSVEILKAGLTAATTFTVDSTGLAKFATIAGGTGSDTLIVTGTTSIDLTSTTVSSVETLKTTSTDDTTFTLNVADIGTKGSIVGGTGTDTLKIVGSNFDVSSTTLSGIEILQAGATTAVKFTVDQSDLAAGGSVIGGAGTDTLIIKSTALDLTALNLSSIEIVKAGGTGGTTFTVTQSQLATLSSSGGLQGGTGSDTLLFNDTSADLSSSSLSSIEILRAGATDDTVFTVNQADLATKGSILGSTGTDTLIAAGTSLDLSSTALSSIEVLKAGLTLDTRFVLDQADFAILSSITGGTGDDTLSSKGTGFDLTALTLSSIEALKAGSASATTFTIDDTELAMIHTLTGSTGVDTLIVMDTGFDLSGVSVSSVEILKAGLNTATTFTLDQADLGKGTVYGSTGSDTIKITGTILDLSSTTLSSVERLLAGIGGTTSTTFKVNQADLLSGGSVVGGGSASDILLSADTQLNLTSTTLTSVETLKAGSAAATTFTVDQADLASGGSIIGGTGADTLKANGLTLDLTSTTLSSVEKITTVNATGTEFILDDAGKGVTLTGGSGADVFTFVTGYDPTLAGADAAILKTLATITGFVGGTGDKIDISALTGGGSFQAQATTQADVNAGAHNTLLASLTTAAAAINNTSGAGVVTAFKFGADTYVLIDNADSSPLLSSNDFVIKLSGTVSLTASDFNL